MAKEARFGVGDAAVTLRLLPPVTTGSRVDVVEVRRCMDGSFRYRVREEATRATVWAYEEDLEFPTWADPVDEPVVVLEE